MSVQLSPESFGWFPFYRGLLEHLRTGKITQAEYVAFTVILGKTEYDTGVWWGNAAALAFIMGPETDERAARALLRSLKRKEYLKDFREKGSRGEYPILVEKWPIFDKQRGLLRINAAKSRSWRRPVLEIERDIDEIFSRRDTERGLERGYTHSVQRHESSVSDVESAEYNEEDSSSQRDTERGYERGSEGDTEKPYSIMNNEYEKREVRRGGKSRKKQNQNQDQNQPPEFRVEGDEDMTFVPPPTPKGKPKSRGVSGSTPAQVPAQLSKPIAAPLNIKSEAEELARYFLEEVIRYAPETVAQQFSYSVKRVEEDLLPKFSSERIRSAMASVRGKWLENLQGLNLPMAGLAKHFERIELQCAKPKFLPPEEKRKDLTPSSQINPVKEPVRYWLARSREQRNAVGLK